MIDIENVLELREQGLTYQAIGDIEGVSRQRIHQVITGYGGISLTMEIRLKRLDLMRGVIALEEVFELYEDL